MKTCFWLRKFAAKLILSLFLTFSTLRSLMGVRQLEGMGEEISLLHMNCEGCEWEMLENLLKHPDVMSKVPLVWTKLYNCFCTSETTSCPLLQVKCLQIGTHYFPEVTLWNFRLHPIDCSGCRTRTSGTAQSESSWVWPTGWCGGCHMPGRDGTSRNRKIRKEVVKSRRKVGCNGPLGDPLFEFLNHYSSNQVVTF